MTLPYLEKIVFKSLARVNGERPDTQRLRDVLLLLLLLPEAVAEFDVVDFEFPVDFELVAFAAEELELFPDVFSGNSIYKNNNRVERRWLFLYAV